MEIPAKKTIMIVEDEPEVRSFLELALLRQGYSVRNSEDGVEALQFLEDGNEEVSLVLMDVVMPRKDGLATLKQLRATHKDLPVVMISGASNTPMIVQAMKSGANDFLAKPIGHGELAAAVQKALTDVPRMVKVPVAEASSGRGPGKSVASGEWMKKNKLFLELVGASDAPVLIQGETGVGKEITAEFLHSHSPRAGKPFLKLNCAALPSELMESELFGFERGAFTGAFKSKPGKFDLADNGTLLLDEIGDMDFKLQAKLLQVLQDQQFERLGGKETIRVNVRVLAATHCDLEKAIEAGRFREDLYHRLNVINISLPPLRERLDEIPALCDLFLARHARSGGELPKITKPLLEALESFHWPGNVRQLENFMRRLLVIRDPAFLMEEIRSRKTQTTVRTRQPDAVPSPPLVKVNEVQRKMESDVILNALNTTRWNRKQAAALLGIDYKAMLYKMKKLGLEERPGLGLVPDSIGSLHVAGAHPVLDELAKSAAGSM